MPLFIVERALPGLTEQQLAALQEALTEASRRLSVSGSPVRYLGTTFIASRARCLCRFEAASAADVRTVNEIAQVPFLSIAEAVESAPGPGRLA